jgi:carbon storage regulator
MLILTRHTAQEIMIGDNIKVTVLGNHKGQVKLGIEAPSDTPVHRMEIYQRIKNLENENARLQNSTASAHTTMAD